MDKILIKLSVPTIEQTIDLFVSPDITVDAMIKIVVPAIIELSGKRYVTSGKESIALLEENQVLENCCSLSDYGIGDGASLLLL